MTDDMNEIKRENKRRVDLLHAQAAADTAPEWGSPIPVDGKRPEWLGDGIPTMVHWSDGDIIEIKSHHIHGWDTSIRAIQVSANHPYYTRTPTIPAALVERMVGLVRGMNADDIGVHAAFTEARAIVADPGFPVEVDPDLVEARECVAMVYDGAGRPELAAQARSGKMDNRLRVQSALAALRRGRALARGEG